MNKKSIYELRKRDRARLLKIKPHVQKAKEHILKVDKIISQIKP